MILIIAIALQPAVANEYFRNRTIIGAGVFVSGGKSILLIDINGDKSRMAPCAATGRFAIDSNSPGYKEIVALVMTAYAKGEAQVDLITANSCSVWGNAQDLIGIKVGTMPW